MVLFPVGTKIQTWVRQKYIRYIAPGFLNIKMVSVFSCQASLPFLLRHLMNQPTIQQKTTTVKDYVKVVKT